MIITLFSLTCTVLHRSPYSATVLLPKPQQGKLTIKAVLIFEDYSKVLALMFLVSLSLQVTIDWCSPELLCIICHFIRAVGIDLNQELILMKESSLRTNNKRGKKEPSLPVPEEVCIIEDGSYEGPSEVLPNSKKSKRVDGSM